MNSTARKVPAILSEQCDRQQQSDAKRKVWWIPWLFVAGFGLSALGLMATIAGFQEAGLPIGRVVFLGIAVVIFGWAAVHWLVSRRIDPRIVPYFARRLEAYGDPTSKAFVRGRGLFHDFVMLERLAAARRVTPLSVFGFEDDYYEQKVRWHDSAVGLETVNALRKGLGPNVPASADLAEDLEALARALRVAAEQGVGFALVLRLRKDSVQAMSSAQGRQGRFW